MLLNFFLEKTPSHNTSLVTCQLIKFLKLPVTKTTIIEALEVHPAFPSLYSISDNLKKWKIDNLALRIDPEKLDEIPVPFVAHLKKGTGYFLVVTKVADTSISYLSDSGKEKQKTREEFLKEWSNVMLFAEPSQQSGEKDFLKQRRKERTQAFKLPFILASCLLFIIAYSLRNVGAEGWIWPSLLLLLKLAGSIVASLLLWFEIDKSNPILKQVCGTGEGGHNSKCTAVLEFRQAKLFGWLSWSAIGFFYFAGGYLLLISGVNSSFQFLAWLNLLALPYTVFSVFFQWKVAKQWCPLCLSVQGILLLEATVTFISHWQLAGLSINDSFVSGEVLLTATISFLIPVFFWMFTKELLLKSHRSEQIKKELNKFKYNPQLFQSLLASQKALTASPDGLGITLGNPNATNTIIKVCNPYCGPCANAHPVIDELLESNDDLKIQMIFMVTNNENDTKTKTVKHLMALYEKGNESLIQKALDDWYNADKKDYDTFAAKYKLNGELQKQGEKIDIMEKWCEETDISFTPTFFVNGYQLPQVYKVEDLKHLLQ